MPWLMKAEPDTRIVKGKDVKRVAVGWCVPLSSADSGVRSHEAKNIMRDKMKLGDKVLFYHSNCKVPGVYALAEISKEGYPDCEGDMDNHPYFDAKSDQENPTWYMVSVRFVERLAYPVTLANVKSLIGLSSPPDGVAYIGTEGLKAVQSMALINRGRLSVQPVEEAAYDAIVAMGRRGGFEEPVKGKGKRVKDEAEAEPETETKSASKGKSGSNADTDKANSKPPSKKSLAETTGPTPKKTKAEPKAKTPRAEPKPRVEGSRRSSRLQK
ncbi:uncharacterized protein COLE_05958 [Cutaneotrichosporon oleaginosum]|uniref:uncharacterized protein n=1 Tax=Cutaneotrichosporon oleaginosum TaxID=879819 RepID=UPI001322E4BB|nr:hypothetical protein COLE_05958 [Cutaneotrichosporon oleaginosum]